MNTKIIFASILMMGLLSMLLLLSWTVPDSSLAVQGSGTSVQGITTTAPWSSAVIHFPRGNDDPPPHKDHDDPPPHG